MTTVLSIEYIQSNDASEGQEDTESTEGEIDTDSSEVLGAGEGQ